MERGQTAPTSPAGADDPGNLRASHCTVIGSWRDPANHDTLAETWNGSTWAKDTTASPGPGADQLSALSCTPGTQVCTAVGLGGGNGLVFAERN